MDERALLVIVLQRRMQREQEIAPRLCELAAQKNTQRAELPVFNG